MADDEGSEEYSYESEESYDEAAAAAARAAAEAEEAATALRDAINVHLESMDDELLYETVNNLSHNVYYLPLENEIFENFLLANEPNLITGMEGIVKTACKLKSGQLFSIETRSEISIQTRSLSQAAEKIERINVSQRIDLVLREIEDLEKNLTKFVIKTRRKKNMLKAELEEIEIRQAEVNDTMKSFETTVIVESFDPLTGRIPAEKFIRYMIEWLKSQQYIVEKMRLRLATTKDKHNKTRVILAQKEEIGESIREVDFEKIIIENQTYAEQVEQKNIHLIELKKMAGRSNLVLSTHKTYLLTEVEQLKNLQKNVEDIKIQNNELVEETTVVIEQIGEEQQNYERIKQYVEDYKVPDVLEYVKLKQQIHDFKREEKILTRKKNLLQVSLSSKIKELKKLAGAKKQEPKWLLPYQSASFASLDSLDSISLVEGTSDESDSFADVHINFDEVFDMLKEKRNGKDNNAK